MLLPTDLFYFKRGYSVFKSSIFVILISVFLVSCQKKNGAESTLMDFINYRFTSGQTKEKLLEYTAGKLHSLIEGMTEEEFEQFAKMEAAKKRKVEINFKNCEEEVCYLTYTVSYSSDVGGKEAFKVDAKKIAELRKSQDEWKVADVSDIKSYYEGTNIIDEKSQE